MRRLTDEPVLSFLQVRYARLPAARERLFLRYFDRAQTYGSDIKSTTEKAAQLPDRPWLYNVRPLKLQPITHPVYPPFRAIAVSETSSSRVDGSQVRRLPRVTSHL